jgi:glyoxylase-like metal-dependent hydrolase (beta-lactamase superfamily II)
VTTPHPKLGCFPPASPHFSLEPLAAGVYACIHQPGGGAYSNAGIINLGERTLLVDAFDTLAAGRDLRRSAESLFDRPVDSLLLTHPHSDHWIGATAFDSNTTLVCSQATRQVCLEWGAELVELRQNPNAWQRSLAESEQRLLTESDPRWRAGLESSITRTRYALAEIPEYQPRYADQTFEGELTFHGIKRTAELCSFGPGHSEDDAALLLPQDGIAFIGDIGFFDTQPFLGYCDIERHRQQLRYFQNSGFPVLVPGHGPLGGLADITLQLTYLDVLEDLVSGVVQRRGSLGDALQINLPEPFDRWLFGGMGRFEINVRTFFTHLGGEFP